MDGLDEPSNLSSKSSSLHLQLDTNSGDNLTTAAFTAVKNRSEPSSEEMMDLEELEQFAKMFKQRRIKLGKLRALTSDGACAMAICLTSSFQ